jgi:hypothetical protein
VADERKTFFMEDFAVNYLLSRYIKLLHRSIRFTMANVP